MSTPEIMEAAPETTKQHRSENDKSMLAGRRQINERKGLMNFAIIMTVIVIIVVVLLATLLTKSDDDGSSSSMSSYGSDVDWLYSAVVRDR